MRQDLTDITIVMDRSGSMESCKEDAIGGLNNFVAEQKKLPGDAIFTLVQFDNETEFVHSCVPLKDVPQLTLVPRGGTALLDAVGKSIVQTGERLAAMNEADRPVLVVFVILTDGGENSSREYTNDRIKEMIQTQERDYKWQFTFLGANQDAFSVAGAMGIAKGGTSNYSVQNTRSAFDSASSNVSRMRSASATGQSVVNGYTDQEKSAMS